MERTFYLKSANSPTNHVALSDLEFQCLHSYNWNNNVTIIFLQHMMCQELCSCFHNSSLQLTELL